MEQWTRQTPWRQGSLLPSIATDALSLHHHLEAKNTLVIVASHDCDLAQAPSTEPRVEVIVGRRINIANGNYTHAKTARTLHLSFEGDSTFWAEFSAIEKKTISKIELAHYFPRDGRLTEESKMTFQRWLASRYHRAAFPDEFERRLIKETRLAESIAKAVKPTGIHITAVLFDVDEGEENDRTGPNDVYRLDITLLYGVANDGNESKSVAEAAKDAIIKAFKGKLYDETSKNWKFIELRYVDVISEEAFTYRQFTLMKRWRLDHASLGGDPQQPIPPN